VYMEKKMTVIRLNEWRKSFETDYPAYLASRATMENERYRSEEEIIFEALSSKEADFSVDEEGKRIVEFIRNMK